MVRVGTGGSGIGAGFWTGALGVGLRLGQVDRRVGLEQGGNVRVGTARGRVRVGTSGFGVGLDVLGVGLGLGQVD